MGRALVSNVSRNEDDTKSSRNFIFIARSGVLVSDFVGANQLYRLMNLVLRLLGLFVVVLGVLPRFAIAEDHAARLQQLVAKKTIEAQNANTHANTLLSGLKSRADAHTTATKSYDSPALHTKNMHEHHMAAVKRPESVQRLEKPDWADSLGPDHKMHSTLAAHGVSDSLVREINNMASSNIQREAIVKHVQTHFPDKDPHEWNDIVVSAIGVAGKAQPDASQTTKSSRNEALLQRQKFKRDKRTLENKQDE